MKSIQDALNNADTLSEFLQHIYNSADFLSKEIGTGWINRLHETAMEGQLHDHRMTINPTDITLSKKEPRFLALYTDPQKVVQHNGEVALKNGFKDSHDLFTSIDNATMKVATFMVPSTIKIVMQIDSERLASYARKIEFIETGGAPMALSDMEKLCALLPSTRLYNTYAFTERGIVATYNFNNGNCVAGCVGKAMRNSIIQLSPEGQIICGRRTLMTGYYKDTALKGGTEI